MDKKQTLKAFLICFNGRKTLLYGVGKRAGINIFRPVGGHVELFEYSKDTIRREVKEELNSGISGLQFLGVIENIFWRDGSKHHEIDFMYYGKLTNKKLYNEEKIEIIDGRKRITAQWLDVGKLSERNVVPPGTYSYMRKLMRKRDE